MTNCPSECPSTLESICRRSRFNSLRLAQGAISRAQTMNDLTGLLETMGAQVCVSSCASTLRSPSCWGHRPGLMIRPDGDGLASCLWLAFESSLACADELAAGCVCGALQVRDVTAERAEERMHALERQFTLLQQARATRYVPEPQRRKRRKRRACPSLRRTRATPVGRVGADGTNERHGDGMCLCCRCAQVMGASGLEEVVARYTSQKNSSAQMQLMKNEALAMQANWPRG